MSEDMTLKSFLFGRKTADFKKQQIDYKFKSLEQIHKEQFGGNMPQTFAEAFDAEAFSASETKALAIAMSNVSMHVTEAGNGLKEAIRANVTKGIADERSSTRIASDMFWDIQVNKDGKQINKSPADRTRKNWNRIAITETQSIYEAGILAPYEEAAEESIESDGKPQYFIFVGGSCKWCRAHQGTLTRLVPASFVKDKSNDSLSSMGIEDQLTDIALWIGK